MTAAAVDKKTKQAMKTSNYILIMVLISALIVLAAGYTAKVLVSSLLLDHKIVTKKSLASANLQKDVDAAKSLSQDYANLGDQITTINNALPSTPDFPGLANALEAMASTAGVTYSSASSATSTTTSAPTTSGASSMASQPQPESFSVSITGGEAGLERFLQTLEASSRPIHVDGFNITGTSSALTVSINGTTYYQLPSTFSISTEAVK